MKHLILIFFLFFALTCYSQQVKPAKPMTYKTEVLAIGTGKQTTYFVETKKHGRKFIYVSPKGAFYYVTPNVDGTYKRNYTKIN